jgi:hypothetical protein
MEFGIQHPAQDPDDQDLKGQVDKPPMGLDQQQKRA